MRKYAIDGNIPKNNIINKMFEIIDSMDEVEKNSLKEYLQELITENKNKVDSKDKFTPSVVGLLTGSLAARLAGNPVTGFGVGAMSGLFTFFGEKAYDQNHKMRTLDLQNRLLSTLEVKDNQNQHKLVS